jgi:hypothetical protein
MAERAGQWETKHPSNKIDTSFSAVSNMELQAASFSTERLFSSTSKVLLAKSCEDKVKLCQMKCNRGILFFVLKNRHFMHILFDTRF